MSMNIELAETNELLDELLKEVERFIHDTGVKDWVDITDSVTANFPVQEPKLFYHLGTHNFSKLLEVHERIKSLHTFTKDFTESY